MPSVFFFFFYGVGVHPQIPVILDPKSVPHHTPLASGPLNQQGAFLLWRRDIMAGVCLMNCASSGLSIRAAACSSDSPIWEEAELQTHKEQSQES